MEEQEMIALWESARLIYLSTLKDDGEKKKAQRYFSMVKQMEKKGTGLKVTLASDYAKTVFENDYAIRLRSCLTLADAPEDFTLEFVVADATPPLTVHVPAQNAASASMPASAAPASRPEMELISMPLSPYYTFEEFVQGPSNSFSYAAAKSVSEKPGSKETNPLFIHGGTGLGKTHLMQAIGNELMKNRKDLRICYLSAENFLNEYVNALQRETMDDFRRRFRSVDVLLIDDVQFIGGRAQFQYEFFNTFYALQMQGKQIVMTSDVAPKNLPNIQSRLISRFEGGMVQEIDSPQYETRLAILRKKAENFSVEIPETALQFIAENIRSHVRAMEGALSKVKIMLLSDPGVKEKLDNYMLENLLKDLVEKERNIKNITCEEIMKVCSDYSGVSMAQLLSPQKTANLVVPRQMAMFIAQKFTPIGVQEIAKKFNRTHATVLHGVKKFQKIIEVDDVIRQQFSEVLAKFGYTLADISE